MGNDTGKILIDWLDSVEVNSPRIHLECSQMPSCEECAVRDPEFHEFCCRFFREPEPGEEDDDDIEEVTGDV